MDNAMVNLLFIVSIILVIGWFVGFVGYSTWGGLIHILLIIAVIAILFKTEQGRRSEIA